MTHVDVRRRMSTCFQVRPRTSTHVTTYVLRKRLYPYGWQPRRCAECAIISVRNTLIGQEQPVTGSKSHTEMVSTRCEIRVISLFPFAKCSIRVKGRASSWGFATQLSETGSGIDISVGNLHICVDCYRGCLMNGLVECSSAGEYSLCKNRVIARNPTPILQ